MVGAYALGPFSPHWASTVILSFRFFDLLGIHILSLWCKTSSSSMVVSSGVEYFHCSRVMSSIETVVMLVDAVMTSWYSTAIDPVLALIVLYPFDHRVSMFANTFLLLRWGKWRTRTWVSVLSIYTLWTIHVLVSCTWELIGRICIASSYGLWIRVFALRPIGDNPT